MQSEDDVPDVEPMAVNSDEKPEVGPAPDTGLVNDDSVETDLVPAGSSPENSVPNDYVFPFKKVRWGGYLPLVVVCLAVVVSLALLIIDFRLGSAFLAASVGLALLFRAVLSDEQAGLLVVRSRVFDLWFLTVLAAALALLAVIVPAPPK